MAGIPPPGTRSWWSADGVGWARRGGWVPWWVFESLWWSVLWWQVGSWWWGRGCCGAGALAVIAGMTGRAMLWSLPRTSRPDCLITSRPSKRKPAATPTMATSATSPTRSPCSASRRDDQRSTSIAENAVNCLDRGPEHRRARLSDPHGLMRTSVVTSAPGSASRPWSDRARAGPHSRVASVGARTAPERWTTRNARPRPMSPSRRCRSTAVTRISPCSRPDRA